MKFAFTMMADIGIWFGVLVPDTVCTRCLLMPSRDRRHGTR